MATDTSFRTEIARRFDLFRGGTGGLDNWLGEDSPEPIFESLSCIETQPLSRARFSQLLTLAHEAPLSEALFRYYWLTSPENHPYLVREIPSYDEKWESSHQIVSLDHLYWGLYRFYVDALLFFGNIRTAFQRLRTLSESELVDFFQRRRIDTNALGRRGDPIGLGTIDRDDRYLISEMACKSYEGTDSSPGELQFALLELYEEHLSAEGGPTTVKGLLEGASEKAEIKERQLQFELSADEFLEETINSRDDLLSNIQRVTTTFKIARAMALQNTESYLSMVGDLDAYVATSMRSREDFGNIADFCSEIFSSERLQPFKLRYFDPTLSAASHHEDKGLIECLMVKCAKVLILNAGSRDSYGKDAEAAMALSLGKPVIIYAQEQFRSRFFREVHPLSRLIDFSTGVTTGAIVATSIDEVIEILRRLFSNELEYELCQPHPRYLVLKEKVTDSVVRLQTSDELLRETFWNHYHNEVR